MMKYHQMSDDQLTDLIAHKLDWIPSEMGHGFYCRQPGTGPVLFGPTYITHHFFEACQLAGVDGGRYRLENGRWVHQLMRGQDCSVAEHESFLRAGCIALARFLEILQPMEFQKVAV